MSKELSAENLQVRWNINMILWGYAINMTCSILNRYGGSKPRPLLFQEKEIDGFVEYDLLESKTYLMPNEIIKLVCPNSLLVIKGDVSLNETLNVSCYKENKYYIDDYDGSISLDDITCDNYPIPLVKNTNKTCNKFYQQFVIDLKIEDANLTLITFCFDTLLQRTLYAKVTLTNFENLSQYSKTKHRWVQGNIYHDLSKTKLDHLYKKSTYKQNINKLLNLRVESNKYIDDSSVIKKTIVKGQLVSKDLFMEGLHPLTYHYVNSAPQWMSVNLGNWFSLNKNIKKFIKMYDSEVIVFSGTHGICELPDEDEILQPVYLYSDDKGNKFVPIPKLFWKVLYDPYTKAGIAFVVVNNPHNFKHNKDVLCFDICKKIPWINWEAKNIVKGYSYCCEVHDLRKSVPEIPDDLVVEKLLY